jgi:hypothetical protein
MTMRIGAIGLVLAAGLAQAEPFVFQGTLNDNGAPANGMYDFQFVLYDALSEGNQVGPFNTLDDVEVIDGAFTVELDFGNDAFDGSERWVSIIVREGDSTGSYVPLNPRAKIGSAPQAGFASRAGVAETIEDPFWTQAPGVFIFGESFGTDKFYLNRDNFVESTDTFVVQSSMNGPGGMTLSNFASGIPYYGYATGGFSRAKTYYDPITDAWVVSKGGQDLLEIDENDDVIITNNLIVNGTITSMNGGGGNVLVGYKLFTPEQIFQGFDFGRLFNSVAGATLNSGSNSYLRMDLELPHGAVVTNINIEFTDRASITDLRVELWSRDRTDVLDYTTRVLGTSSGFDLNMVQVMDIIPSPAIVIDNTQKTYTIRGFSTSGTWPTVGNLGIRSVLVEYEQTLP